VHCNAYFARNKGTGKEHGRKNCTFASMLTKKEIKHYNSLQRKKHRDQEQSFLVEGRRSVAELLSTNFSIRAILALPEWIEENPQAAASNAPVVECAPQELHKISSLQSPPSVIAVVNYKKAVPAPLATDQLILALDTIQDPGNLGTIIRTADWFGIRHIVCTHQTADQYNPKVVQATMGALARVDLCYTHLPQYISENKRAGVTIYGTLLSGTDMYSQPIGQHGVIVLGNEGNGISAPIASLVDKALYIPHYPQGSTQVESLNVGIAAAIVCAEFRRRASD